MRVVSRTRSSVSPHHPNLLFAYRPSTGSERTRHIGHTAYPLKKSLEHLEVNRQKANGEGCTLEPRTLVQGADRAVELSDSKSGLSGRQNWREPSASARERGT